MLSTSENKLQQPRYLLIAVSILVLLLAVAAPRLGAIPSFSADEDLTSLSASAVSAYRWNGMAKFYSSQQVHIPVTGEDLTTRSAADISAYRWQAMAMFYIKQAPTTVKYGPPGR